MLNWMAWTLPTAIFFISIAVMLATMTVLQLVWPTVERKGFLPMATTRGDRLFIGLLTSAFIHLGWLALTSETTPLWGASIISLIWFAALMRWG
jgi:predicted small integral membrane protein